MSKAWKQGGQKQKQCSLLAWARWQMQIPSGWQPLKLTGTPQKGQMIVGDEACAIFVIKWERALNSRITDGPQWVNERLMRQGVVADAHPPGRQHFSACAWARDVQTEEDKETTFWYGFSEASDLLMGITINGVLSKPVRQQAIEAMKTLVTTALTKASVWAMYDLSFAIPGGFELLRKHLYSGDMALLFTRGRRESLLVRQVYPGGLALQRRNLDAWLNSNVFKEHRRMRQRGMYDEVWQHGSRKALGGRLQQGWKRIPVPLGWCSPRLVCRLAVHDQVLDRLLIVEHLETQMASESMVIQVIENMNLEAGGNTITGPFRNDAAGR